MFSACAAKLEIGTLRAANMVGELRLERELARKREKRPWSPVVVAGEEERRLSSVEEKREGVLDWETVDWVGSITKR